jgi:hypothetical protein
MSGSFHVNLSFSGPLVLGKKILWPQPTPRDHDFYKLAFVSKLSCFELFWPSGSRDEDFRNIFSI